MKECSCSLAPGRSQGQHTLKGHAPGGPIALFLHFPVIKQNVTDLIQPFPKAQL